MCIKEKCYIMKENNKLHERLVEAIKKSMSNGDTLVNELTDVLYIGKEAVYRRLRGEVAFTFDEIATLSRKYGFSLDSIVGVNSYSQAVFDLRMFDPEFQVDDYCSKTTSYIENLKRINQSSNSMARFALNALPLPLLLTYNKLTKLRLYRWMYQSKKSLLYYPFSEFQIPDKILDLHKVYIKEMNLIQKTLMVLDHNVFTSFIKEIAYFFKLNYLSKDDLEEIKAELLLFIDDLEEASISGKYNGFKDVNIYVSEIDLDSTYIHYECNEFEMALFRLYSMNTIESCNEEVCRIHKEWIESFKRYSTLITQSGERQRYMYISSQKEAVRNLFVN